MRLVIHRYVVVFIGIFIASGMVRAADAPYVPTPWNVVEALFKLGGVGPADYLIDLGSGDGRIVIAAAKQFGAQGLGAELSENLVRTARREAEQQGVSGRVKFVVEDLFFMDLAKATVLTLYMSESVNLRLRPALFKLKPGTRVLSHDFDMAQWQPDGQMTVPVPNKPYGAPKSEIFLWVVPADASGRWQLTVNEAKVEYDATFEQTFQMISGSVAVAGRSTPVTNARVRGEVITFTLPVPQQQQQQQQFSGRITGDVMQGEVSIAGVPATWRATRVSRGRMNIEAANTTHSVATAFFTRE